ncbi:hypothetical protein FACS1894111_05760 [Clostridia bacterium]|nr:hypothetical protein FACS1894111_05760 [Clostridia bacterium]
MRGFKKQAKRDIKAVFHNTDEHADKITVGYNGKTYPNIPIVIDHEGARERTKPSSDHADGVFVADLTVYLSFYDLKIVPRKETEIVIDETAYNIMRVSFDEGEITLDLEMMDE